MVFLYQIERRVTMEVKSEGTAVGVAYWFTLHLYGDITIATYQPMEVSITHTHTRIFTIVIYKTYTYMYTIKYKHAHLLYFRLAAIGIRACFCSRKM